MSALGRLVGGWAALLLASGCATVGPRIELADGYAAGGRAYVFGRIVEDPPFLPADPLRPWTANLVENLGRLLADPVPGVEVALETGVAAVAAPDGFFALEGPSAPEVTVRARGLAPSRAKVFELPPGPALVVVSDFDDTLAETRVVSPLWLVRNTLARNAAQIPMVRGAARSFRAARSRGVVAFFYLSGSPEALRGRIEQFLARHGFPPGPLLLKRPGVDPTFDQLAYKREKLRELLRRLPEASFVLVGDSGERDPEVYRAIREEHPGRVRGIVIRRAPGAREPAERFRGMALVPDFRADPLGALLGGD